MGKDTGIEWCHHTFNPWWGCTKVSPACHHCYAESFAKRVGRQVWGEQAPRRLFGDAHWAEPLKWNRDAQAAGERRRVFCASMADVFEGRPDLDEHRARLWKLIAATPWLDWLLLTKRPENVLAMVPWQVWPENVWCGTTAEDRHWLSVRAEHLAQIPAAVTFLSMEPLLERVSVSGVLRSVVDWVIVGAESGAHARAMDEDWVRSLRDECQAAGVPLFYKQKVVGRLKIGTPELDGRSWTEFPA